MKKRSFEIVMGIMLLAGIFILSREVVQVMNTEDVVSKVILIDPGHGGSDPGMIGIDDLQEKEINLAIALKLKECLEKAGYKAVMTRETDTGLYDESTHNKKVQDLQRRCDMIAEYRPYLTVSIHQNSYSDPAVKGPQVFYYADSAQGRELAGAIQEQLNRQLEIERPRVEKGNTSYYLLKKSKGVLNIVECGFLTNTHEAALLVTPEYQQKVARAICDGIAQYLKSS